jgi:hypothetical protein
VSLLFAAVACLVAAQIIGIYALVSKKADLVFSLVMVLIVLVAVALGAVGAYDQIG